jgi:hypothetical protein
MKAVIKGVTYNTETSTMVAEAENLGDDDDSSRRITELYRNRSGVYFMVVTRIVERGELTQPEVSTSREWAVIDDPVDFCQTFKLTITGDIEGLPPESPLPQSSLHAVGGEQR